MIGKIKGLVNEIGPNFVLLDPGQNVFYKVFLPAINMKDLKIGDSKTFYIHFHVRENEISLYGFADRKQLRVYNILLNISGVGAKSALSIIGFDRLEKMIDAVNQQNPAYFSQIPGIGKKTAQKILLDLSNKFEVEFKPQSQSLTQDDQLVVDALQSLGFKKAEALSALSKVDSKLTLEEKITQAIKNLNTHESIR
ncbi:Holliday junction DNA helicase RuvA [Candidatus Roizmanbacteria bacterium RIFOXYB2_FULL_41_10]|uniref:Holliday junction branch migration complex subunit RuvA n=1 Tax=Candidatus Roizmanbacteria bacterium RIFOXYA1_FULL_41_12 TaxID=1802082 RepID=A0A1F7KFL7_9BACT|nr:MAG: Holliday junction DNA helicase RuvA [Candidatus Roizmanbacteria bacterium RIFOXYA1_FULL_41_12]OGK67081.1 MAG: Holliday junction DNA helicase RuvA [Candidatus Roizmanbacteria bacterium RIFOXYA2_FULL_41_8]OGK67726.1 MAG: Holliday junction DNA helicase RuvA [Candidatus Roizmanbacteria bacterium RIFOXYB1_FULL_41_27]OGK70697.1 MAG: Holliday junction DNA helicase RuvA [Candidatus Roizmanbacteria bacterium RIFOXYC1_FULL_41_16]OGK71604.1 MAG: Holliday junction DNA helicase RuvA [Candidatus Roiz